MTTISPHSVSIEIRPADKRCRYWAKRIDAGRGLSLPDSIGSAKDIPGPFLNVGGEDELAVGDFIIEGEEVHHRHQRGWTYRIGFMGIDGALHRVTPNKEHKQAMKAAGMPLHYLRGSGELAACVRLIAGLRLGLDGGVLPIETEAALMTMQQFAEVAALKDVWFESSSPKSHPSAQQIYDQAVMRAQMLSAQDGMKDLPNLAALLGD